MCSVSDQFSLNVQNSCISRVKIYFRPLIVTITTARKVSLFVSRETVLISVCLFHMIAFGISGLSYLLVACEGLPTLSNYVFFVGEDTKSTISFKYIIKTRNSRSKP